MSFESDLQQQLAALRSAHLLRTEAVVRSSQGPRVLVDSVTCIHACSNNYLGFADDPRLAAAAAAAVVRVGTGSAASRLVSGTMALHTELESALARFVGAEEAVLFSSGYAANVGTISALVGPDDVVFSDALNHASLIDGCRLSRAVVHVFPHRDYDALATLLVGHRHQGHRALVVSDAMFSMDGDFADVSRLRELCDEFDAALVLDEAHTLGTLGPRGRGLAAVPPGSLPTARPRAEVLVGTLGKSFGVAGAFVAGSSALAQVLRNRARSYVFSTAPGVASVAAALEAVRLVDEADDRRGTLLRHTHALASGLRQAGFTVTSTDGPIVPVIVGPPDATVQLADALLRNGVFARAIRPPTVPRETSRIRLVPIATHTDADITSIVDAFRSATAQGAVR